jgi:hypothetical protein
MAVTKVAKPPYKVIDRFNAWRKTTAPTEMFAASDYEKRIVGYMKVTVSLGIKNEGYFPRKEVNAGQRVYLFPVRCDGYVMSGSGYLDNNQVPVMNEYIIDATAEGDIDLPADFALRTGLLIEAPKFNDVITFLRTSGLGYKDNSKNIGVAAVAVVIDSNVFDSINNDPNVAFFLVDITPDADTVNIYVCKKDPKNKYNVDWKVVTITVPRTTNWDNIQTNKPFCTTDLSQPLSPIKFYQRSITMLECAGVDASVATPKKDPPPFNFFDIVKKIKDVKIIIKNIADGKTLAETRTANETAFKTSVDEKTRIDKNAKNLVFLEDLKAVGCVGDDGSDTNILGDKCDKIDALKKHLENDKFVPPTYTGGRRSKRNKHRRNKRTVSHRGRGHKRSRRVDGGSRKCGKKCRRKHTRK